MALNRQSRSIPGLGSLGAERLPVVFVSASTEDACAFRESVDPRRLLIVNVPDLAGARAVIDKIWPALVLCDLEIEGEGSWRDLLGEYESHRGFALVVVSGSADEALRIEVLDLGGSGVIEKPFTVVDIDRVIDLGFQGVREECGAVAGKSILNAARWSRQGEPRI
jgi:DNA-binding NarL/FixJ family response regulator